MQRVVVHVLCCKVTHLSAVIGILRIDRSGVLSRKHLFLLSLKPFLHSCLDVECLHAVLRQLLGLGGVTLFFKVLIEFPLNFVQSFLKLAPYDLLDDGKTHHEGRELFLEGIFPMDELLIPGSEDSLTVQSP